MGRTVGRTEMKILTKEYLGGVISLLLLIFGILVLPFAETGLPRIFSLCWMAVILLPTVAFIGKVRKKEQLLAVRKSWGKKAAVQEGTMHPGDEHFGRRSRENNSD